jgi:5'-3' exonuclease
MIKALYLIDGYNLIYQAYYAFKNRHAIPHTWP